MSGSVPPSVRPDHAAIDGTLRVLARVEALPVGATGVLRFADAGTILVESRLVCWAVATRMRQRLTDLLRHQRSPPLDRAFLEATVRRCRESGTPLGQALLSSGQITEAGLRTALFRQTVQAITQIGSEAPLAAPEFTPHASHAYDARFLFETADIFAALAAREDRALAAAGKAHLEQILAPGTTGVCAEERTGGLVAVVHPARMRVETLSEASTWSRGLFAVVSTLRPDCTLAVGTWRGIERAPSVVTWRAMGLHFTALTDSRAAATVLACRIAASTRRCAT